VCGDGSIGGVTDQNETWATAGFESRPPPQVFVQWKNTEVCLDFRCPCGYEGHFDGMFAYGLRCARCGAEWAMPHTFGLLPDPDGVVQDTAGEPHQDGSATEVAYAEMTDSDD
jgi:hypothetical protein